jgi:hypothetical protein
MVRKTPDTLIDHAQELIARGALLKEAAAAIRVGPDNLSQHLRARGIVVPRGGRPAHNRRTDLPERKMIALYGRGVSELAIARKFGASRMWVRNLLIKNGIPIRGISEANFLRMNRIGVRGRKLLTTRARKVRHKNLVKAAHDPSSKNPAIGIGEREIADALERLGHRVTRRSSSANTTSISPSAGSP